MKQLLVLLLSCFVNVSAQDVIVKKDGNTILSKVTEVNSNDIKYKKFSNLNGPTYTLDKSEIMSINYENGERDTFDQTDISSANNKRVGSQRLIKKKADERNAKLIKIYNKEYGFRNIKEKNTGAKYYILIFGAKSSSIMSNEDIEMKIVRGEKISIILI